MTTYARFAVTTRSEQEFRAYMEGYCACWQMVERDMRPCVSEDVAHCIVEQFKQLLAPVEFAREVSQEGGGDD